jgi:hypothetical protein
MAGFLVVLGLVVLAVLLFRSMLKHLRRVPPSFEQAEAEPPPAVSPPSTDAGV